MIKFEHVSKFLGGSVVLEDLTFEIEKGEVFVIVGASGSGKSVTLKHMVRLLTPNEGRIMVGDDCINEASGSELVRIRERFGYLFQGGALLAWLSVGENVALPLREKTKRSEDEIQDRVQRVLGLVGLEKHAEKMPAEVSGGMRKRASLARAIVQEPEIVLYDEPTSGLDPVTSRTIDELVARLTRELGITSVVVTHDLHSALSIGDRIAMLRGGSFIEVSSPADFVKSSNETVRGFLDAQFVTRSGPWERTQQHEG